MWLLLPYTVAIADVWQRLRKAVRQRPMGPWRRLKTSPSTSTCGAVEPNDWHTNHRVWKPQESKRLSSFPEPLPDKREPLKPHG